VLANNSGGLVSWMQSGADAFCGWGGVLTAMAVMPKIGAGKVQLLKYANSGDTAPEGAARGVVGYSAIAYILTGGKSSTNPSSGGNTATPGTGDYSLDEKQKLYLIQLARKTVAELVKNGKHYEPAKPEDAKLVEDAPVFVTLHRSGQLRGCIGQMMARGPLYLAVRDMAIAAASEDYRFQPVSESELDAIDIEISVLSPMKRISSWEEIEPFKHGVYVKRGFNSGVFLPQVWGQIPDKEAFLGELCAQKAHLERDCYKKPGTEIYVYTVFEFSEKEMGLK